MRPYGGRAISSGVQRRGPLYFLSFISYLFSRNEVCQLQQLKQKKIPVRRCVGCNAQRPKRELVRVVRSPEGLVEKVEPLKKKSGWMTWPLIRGVVNFASSMVSGVKALMYSAEFFPEEEEDAQPSKFEQWLEKKLGSEKLEKAVVSFSVFLGVLFSVGLFFLLPTLLSGIFDRWIHNAVVRSLIEGVIRIAIFMGYMILISRMKDMKRVFSYHGAEHKTIRCYEAKLPLTDDCAAVERLGKQGYLLPGNPENIKITRPLDLAVAAAILRQREERNA